MATFFQKKPAVGLSLKRDKTGPLSIVNIVLLRIHYKNFMPRLKGQWHSEEENGRTAPGGNQEGAAKMGVIRGASGISRLLWEAKLQSAPGADNPRYAAEKGV